MEILTKLRDYFNDKENSLEQKNNLAMISVQMLKNFFAHSEINGNTGIQAFCAVDRGVYLKDVLIELNMTAKAEAAKCIELSVY